MSSFRRDPERDAWERQPGEPAEQFDWFAHYRNDGHRRSYARTAEKFDVTAAKVRNAAQRYDWADRLAEFKRDQSKQTRERFDDLIEQGLAPFAQAFARLSALAVANNGDKVAPDRALQAASSALRVAREPEVQALIRTHTDAGADQYDIGNTILSALDGHPEAKRAALDALRGLDQRSRGED